MEPQLSRVLNFRSISDVTNETISYIRARKDHTIEPLKTRWKKFNRICSIEPNMIFTIGGASGSGKSSFINTLETDLIDLNPDKKIFVLSFSFEMLSYRQVGRKLSSKLRQTTNELYSADIDLSDSNFAKVKEAAHHIRNYNIYYVDTASNVENIEKTIDFFYESKVKPIPNAWFIIVLDHGLLVEGSNERQTLTDLQNMFIRKKKLPKTSIFQIAQLNRNIESSERITNPSMHFPMRSDFASSDALFRASDYVIALSRPELLNIPIYGIQRLPVTNKVYLHVLKVRDSGEPCILAYDNDLKYNNLIEN